MLAYNRLDQKGKIRRFMYMLFVLTVGLFIMSYKNALSSYNSTIMALSYKYGFASRGLLGSFYRLVDKILPVDMRNYESALHFTLVMTVMFFLFLLFFAWFVQSHCREEYLLYAQCILAAFFVLVVSSFSGDHNFGRVDMYMMAFSILGVVLLISEKAEILLIPICALAVMVHQGYVFMYFNIILVLLLYKMLSRQGKQKRYYGILFILCFVTGSALFVWFEFLSRTNGSAIFDAVKADAVALSYQGEYHVTLLEHEVLGTDLATEEWSYHLKNFVEAPIFLFFFLPFLVYGIKMCVNIIHAAVSKIDKWKYVFVAIGSFTLLPIFALKVDFGRWFIALMVYYCVIFLALLAMGDTLVETQVQASMHRLKTQHKWAELLAVYPLVFMPIWDVNMGHVIAAFSHIVNVTLLHWW